MLRDEVRDIRDTVNTIDSAGTRGIGVIHQQVSELIRDVGDLKTDLKGHELKHEQTEHERQKQRRSNVRWLVMLVVTIILGLGGLYAFLAQIAASIK